MGVEMQILRALTDDLVDRSYRVTVIGLRLIVNPLMEM
jgi:hypothetical protein